METHFRLTTDQLLDEAAEKAAAVTDAESLLDVERILLGVLASGDPDERHHERMEKIQSDAYKAMIPGYAYRISLLDTATKRYSRMHLEAYSLLHAASMTGLDAFVEAVDFVKDLKDPEADRALTDFYPAIDDEKLSMFEHDKIRNGRNNEYFHDIQRLMREMVPQHVPKVHTYF